MLELLIVLYFELENLNRTIQVDFDSMFIIISYSILALSFDDVENPTGEP
jgi:hypothetical protein